MVFGETTGAINHGNILIEKTVVKERYPYTYTSGDMTVDNIKIIDSAISTSNIYEGSFDFDNEKYYKNPENWVILNGNEAFDLAATFIIEESESLPVHQSADFWLDYSAISFAGGDGSEESPYLIANASQLALLSRNLFYSNTYS